MEHNNDSINYFKKNLYLAPMIATFPMFSVRISLVVVGGVGGGRRSRDVVVIPCFLRMKYYMCAQLFL